ncbi:transposase [Prevotella sp. E15-22]|uniref:transposase n=1 Tax=Prevotella sp. E15-22 TaxID=2937774 RepID=UPI00205EB4F3|nr:transposase [Prevotella sp. E15-22]UPS43463.1 transposase [Prevotella sp. E15-22]
MTEGQWKRRPADPMRHHRENGWDYKGRAIYHFTLPVEDRYPLFGTLAGENAETAFVRLNSFGRRVYAMLNGLPLFYAERGFALKVLALKVMPDHVHLVIQVLEQLPQSIGAVVRGFKSGCTKVYKEMYMSSGENAAGVNGNENGHAAGAQGNGRAAGVNGNENGRAAGAQGNGGAAGVNGNENENAAGAQGNGGVQGEGNGRAAGVDGEDAPMHFARIFANRGSIWEQNPAYYHERILHAPGQLRRMIDYVKDNPRRLWIKRHNPDLFRLHRQTGVAGLLFTSMGNHFLLDWPDRQVVEISRSATDEEVQERLRMVLAAAHNGAVTYTAAISKGEQLIARTMREQGYPLVVLLNAGFPKEGSPHERFFKPGGVYFEACSRGQLLLLEPTEQAFLDSDIQAAVEETLMRKAEARHFTYAPVPVTSQRYRFVALNEMAKWIQLYN